MLAGDARLKYACGVGTSHLLLRPAASLLAVLLLPFPLVMGESLGSSAPRSAGSPAPARCWKWN